MLFVRLHVLADHYPVASSVNFKPGQVVALNSSGQAILQNEGSGDVEEIPIGIAGDEVGTLSAKQFSNKAWELGDETAGSRRLTVYHGGGSFYVDYGSTSCDVCEDTSLTVGAILKTDDDGTDDGKVSKDGTEKSIYRVENLLTETSGYLDSGIPGPVYQPVGDVDSARKFALVRLLI
jgi:hypothetical protein